MVGTHTSDPRMTSQRLCGFCCDCQNVLRPVEPSYRARHVRSYAIDLVPAIIPWLQYYFREVDVTVVHAAISNRPGGVLVPRGASISGETWSLSGDSGERGEQRQWRDDNTSVNITVPVMHLLDALGGPTRAPHHIFKKRKIDFLSIDAERV